MAKSSNEIARMFAERRELAWGPTTGSAWAQRKGSEAAGFWLTAKQSKWLVDQWTREQGPRYIRNRHETPEGEFYLGGVHVHWLLGFPPKGQAGRLMLVK